MILEPNVVWRHPHVSHELPLLPALEPQGHTATNRCRKRVLDWCSISANTCTAVLLQQTPLSLLPANVPLQEPSTSTSRRVAEVATCQGAFFDGPDQLCKLSHGVYEGNYWQLLGDLAELEDMLGRMTRAPVLLQEPTLELPQQPELPKYVNYSVQAQSSILYNSVEQLMQLQCQCSAASGAVMVSAACADS